MAVHRPNNLFLLGSVHAGRLECLHGSAVLMILSDMLTKEDIFITRNGKIIAKVINPQVSAVDSLRGMLKNVPSDIDLNFLREERLSKYFNEVV